jgi:hypothetical protein
MAFEKAFGSRLFATSEKPPSLSPGFKSHSHKFFQSPSHLLAGRFSGIPGHHDRRF